MYAGLPRIPGSSLASRHPTGGHPPVPALMLGVLIPFRATEDYGHVCVDGALLVGALLALAL